MTDPLLRMLADLPQAEPHPARAARVRVACHAALARRRPHPPVRSGRRATRIWEPVVAGLGGIYLTETLRQALHLYGLL